MHGLKALLRGRVGLLVALLVVCGGALAPHSPAEALVCNFRPLVITFYSDATKTVEVGQEGTDCDCNSFSWGTTSSFRSDSFLCCNVNTC